MRKFFIVCSFFLSLVSLTGTGFSEEKTGEALFKANWISDDEAQKIAEYILITFK